MDHSSSERGFTLAALIVILTIMSIIVAYTVPQQWSLVMKRERDRQTIFLMKQYARGIRAWQRKHGGLPVSLQQLQDARAPRMLRGDGKWPMPLTGDEKHWIMVPAAAITNAPAGGGPGGGPGPGHIGPGKKENGSGTGGSTTGGSTGGSSGGSSGGSIGGSDRSDKGRGGSRGGGRGRGGRGGGGRDAGQQPPANQGPAAFSKLDPAQSPASYVGPFVGIRPNAKGPSFISLNGASDYGEWVYTIYDLEVEIASRQMAISRP